MVHVRKCRLGFLLCLLWLVIPISNALQAQIIYGASATQDSLWGIDTTTWSVVQRTRATLAGNTITGVAGLAYDPVEHVCFALLKVSAAPNSTLLATINPQNGLCTQVGNLGLPFTSITCRADGQLMGVVGDGGGANAEKVLLIDKATAATSPAVTLGNGDSGEVICFNGDEAMVYHWSGSSAMVVEKFPASAPYNPLTHITTTGTPGAEKRGAIYLGNGRFITAEVGNQLRRLGSTGQYGPVVAQTPDALTGMIMPPTFNLSDNLVCINELVTWHLRGLATDTAFYNWGDGTIDRVYPAGPATHIYLSAGNKVVNAGLKNSIAGADTLVSGSINVNPLPGVSLSPSQDTILCLADTLVITGSFGGQSQWYRNGIAIPGANTNVYASTVSGWYNMQKRNTNGCIDSAQVGIAVIFASQAPSPSISFDTTGCPTVIFQNNDAFATQWAWTFGDGGSSNAPNPSHTYAAVGTYAVALIATNACYATPASASVVVDCFIGTQAPSAPFVKLVPNPSSGHATLLAELSEATQVSYRIADLQGRILYSGERMDAQGSWSVAIPIMPAPGIYSVYVQADGKTQVLRWLVQ